MMKETLTQAVIAYKESGENWNRLLDRISLIVYKYPGKWTNWDEDKCSEFFLSFFPKIPGIVNRFQPRFRFETYLSSSLKWYTKTFNEKIVRREYYESWSVEISEADALRKSGFPVMEQLFYPENCPFELEDNGMLKDPALRRRILYTVLLRAADIDNH
ncbi:MAG: hypothetical protein KAH21_10485 [Spirochaetaceae bacterium]|nr:hypothetical protein [Spirochaetaceae bacterium]